MENLKKSHLLAPINQKCEGVETYNEDLSGNGFLDNFGGGHIINEVVYVSCTLPKRVQMKLDYPNVPSMSS